MKGSHAFSVDVTIEEHEKKIRIFGTVDVASSEQATEINMLNEAIACCDGDCKAHLSNMRRHKAEKD